MTGTWTTAYLAALAGADDALPFFPPPRRFTGQTVRQRVRLRRGGRAARLELSNEFGRDPLVIDAVLVGNGDLTSATPALYRGAGTWEIPAGETAISDPIPLPVTTHAAATGGAAPGGELVVDCLVSGYAEAATFLPSAQQTGEVAPGDQLGRPRLADSERFTALYWIARVLTDRPASGPVVVTLGDSITRGDGTTPDLDQRYPDHLQRRLLAAGVEGAVVLNAGIGGNRLLRPVIGPSMTDRFDRDVLGVPEATHVLILAGTNDISLPSMLGERRPAADEIVDGLRALARPGGRARRSTGARHHHAVRRQLDRRVSGRQRGRPAGRERCDHRTGRVAGGGLRRRAGRSRRSESARRRLRLGRWRASRRRRRRCPRRRR